jgi:hypothetical protein
VDQHLGTKIHKEKKQTPNTLVQQLFTNNQAVKNSPQENFSKDLTNLFVSLNIPLHKIDHPLFQQFFKTYCPDSKILSSSTLRKKFVDSNYISVMAAHGLNRVAETIRLEFPLVNSLVTNIKKVFIKAPLRVQVYREKLPGIPLPPEPVLTRWGTWLKAVDFISTNYNGIKEVISDFSCDSSIAIKKCVNLFRDPLLKNQLA